MTIRLHPLRGFGWITALAHSFSFSSFPHFLFSVILRVDVLCVFVLCVRISKPNELRARLFLLSLCGVAGERPAHNLQHGWRRRRGSLSSLPHAVAVAVVCFMCNMYIRTSFRLALGSTELPNSSSGLRETDRGCSFLK